MTLRREDDRLLRGRGRFADDENRVRQAHLRLVRSADAHGRIVRIDAEAARRMPGVIDVVTAAELAKDLGEVPVIPMRMPRGDEPDGCLQPVLPVDEVRYVGQPVAAVLAEDPYLAEDAAEAVEVDVEPLPVLLDPGTAEPIMSVRAEYGSTEAAFAAAEHVVELTLGVQRHAAVPLEPRALLAEHHPGTDSLEIWGLTKVPVFNRDVLAGMLGMPAHRIRAYPMDVGGGFGARGEFYPEDLLVPWLARRLGRPVKWTEDRAEALVALNHSRDQTHHIAAAFTEDGRLLALRDRIVHDNGGYLRTHGVMVPELSVSMLPGPYRVPAYSGRADVVLTHKTPCGTYRAPGRYEGTFAREHLLDVAADRLGIDRIELRRRNLLTPAELPHRRPIHALRTDVVLDAGDYPGLLELARSRTEDWRAEAAARRGVGYGLAMFLEKSGLGPHETADVIVHPSGRVSVHSGGTSLGQGIETVLGQVAAAVLTVPAAHVDVVNGDTELQPFGMGSWASRSSVVAGSAVHVAALAVVERAREVAARLLEADPRDVELHDGRFAVAGTPGSGLALAQVAEACSPGSPHLLPGEEPGLAMRRRFEVAHMTYPYGVHAALVEVDADTGKVDVRRYLVAYEVGRALNPALVEGQLIGGVAQGLGGAVYERFSYDDAGQPTAATFMDYLIPTAAEMPARVTTVLREDAPSPDNPLGVKGAGEGGITAAGAAVANAVRDALELPGSVGALPLDPARVASLAWSEAVSG
ncbi:xanthine dehydrogenase family protein molybdopterin-binding subunit [Pseudonocardia acaciae]|uniref:xanthine dehydrogenase family protein molybdopterin-binding subunit n=1 Tax=Pseudonocardia acaciae TaxID=551276 RepID=UPI0005605955|nr:xanthine dehydrogenase family protein molybdopterin-binding subunit [Pseudonocardia acaciae]